MYLIILGYGMRSTLMMRLFAPRPLRSVLSCGILKLS
jgi:hypothetical protein